MLPTIVFYRFFRQFVQFDETILFDQIELKYHCSVPLPEAS
jgi:hypothetical protein